MKESNEEREFKEFFKGTWDILEKPGSQEVTLTRKYNDETIEISFSTTDAAQMEQPGAESEVDEVYEDEEFGQPEASPQSRGANTKGSVNAGKTQDANIRVAPEDRVAPADRPEPTGEEGDYGDEEGDRGSSFPVRLLIKITRDGKPGAMEIDAEASGGYLDVHNAAYWPSTDLTARTAEAELKRAMLYGGPSFHTLDDDLQSLMMAFLEERGIDVEMCLRLPDVVDWKEQREYNKWLHGELAFPNAFSPKTRLTGATQTSRISCLRPGEPVPIVPCSCHMAFMVVCKNLRFQLGGSFRKYASWSFNCIVPEQSDQDEIISPRLYAAHFIL